MFASIYKALESIGYTHPLHPTLTHVTIGAVIAALVFGLVHWAFRREGPAQSARHCTVLALVAWFPTALLGYADWQYHLGGAMAFPIIMKIVLAGALLVLLVLAVVAGRKGKGVIGLYTLCFLAVVGIAYFGGELVYEGRFPGAGAKAPQEDAASKLVQQGSAVFSESCAMCHYTDKKETKVGPGLAGLFSRDELPVSKRPVTEENVRSQIRSPYENMPDFAEMPKEKVDALLAYLKTL
jgi:cytochrome c2